MPAPTPDYVRYRIQELLELQIPTDQVCKATGVTIRTVQRIQKNLRVFGQAERPRTSRLGRPPLLTEADKDQMLLKYLKLNPTPYLNEISHYLLREGGVEISSKSIGRAL
ncbi:hypothetical protein B0A49_05850 [Cryomyces minteri]|uniref:Paired domain-containing protein n=1 Tax=Cryomyces minteri TaxID=331657 RepID=A0A4U0X2T0_9PEZI|nr:hypothetical protein B0A49_05850 [Cryomyces minteri]